MAMVRTRGYVEVHFCVSNLTNSMFIGAGFTFAPLSNSADVVAHEYMHGVTQYSSGLIYWVR
jgi:hypothetical protein